MPEPGELQRGIDIGRKDYHKYMWSACAQCGVLRWVQIRGGKPQSKYCYNCGRIAGKPRGAKSRDQHPRWRGGRHITSGGYIQIVVPLDSPFISMSDDRGRVYEHRLVMAQHLGRCLFSSETVHHRNRDKQDNRIENLEILSRSDHSSAQQEIERLAGRISELERENARLRNEPKPETT